MKHASKREAKGAAIEARRQDAILKNDVAAFQQAVAELAGLENEPDVFTCPICGEDFEGDHVELLIAAVQVIKNGEMFEHADYGIQDAFAGEDAGEILREVRGSVENSRDGIFGVTMTPDPLRAMNLGENQWRYMIRIPDFHLTGHRHLFVTQTDPTMRFYPTLITCETLVGVLTRGTEAVFSIGYNVGPYDNIVRRGETPAEPFYLSSFPSSDVSIPASSEILLNITKAAIAPELVGRVVVLGYYSNPFI